MKATRLDAMSGSAGELEFPMTRLAPIDIRARVSEEEWSARCDLAALYRLVAHYRWTDLIYNHISLRVPGEEHFLINPFGYLYEEITASSLVKVNLDGDIVDDPVGFGINRAGFVIHGAIHGARHDVACVLHTHTRAGIAVSAQKEGLLPISQHAAMLMAKVAYHDAEGVAVRMDEQARLVANLGSRSILILRNHGLLVAGRNPGETLNLAATLERACEAQVAAQGQGATLSFLSEAAIEESRKLVDALDGDFSRDWAAMRRLVERIGPDYSS